MRDVKIYLAGKIAKNDWRSRWGSLSVGCFDSEPPGGYAEAMADYQPPEIRPGVVVGPRFLNCDHGCYHGDGSHGAAQDTVIFDDDGEATGTDPAARAAAHARVYAACLQQIRSCTVFFAWLGGNDAETAFGTLVEVGYAIALGKRVYIGADRRIDNLWFATQGATAVLQAATPDDALDKLFGVYHAK